MTLYSKVMHIHAESRTHDTHINSPNRTYYIKVCKAILIFVWFLLIVTELKNWRISQIFERQSNSDERRRCSLCGKVVTNVRNHYYVHFPGKYACPLCPAVYTRSDTLLTHTRMKHAHVQQPIQFSRSQFNCNLPI